MQCQELFKIFKGFGVNFFTGVPDSTFKGWMSFLDAKNGKDLENIVACNECEAIAIASGYHLATGKIGVVYMQNSGLGKTVNPLTSLCDPEVYSIPLIMLIGWRGKPGEKDEPQHRKMGHITLPLLETLEVPYEILPSENKAAQKVLKKMHALAMTKSRPVALIIQSDVIEEYSSVKKSSDFNLGREETIGLIVQNLPKNSLVVSTTGKISRELYEIRVKNGQKPSDFYTVGSMGCSASIGLGIALQKSKKSIFVLDGDGAVIMQMGALSTIGHYQPKNLIHIVLDNESYDSTGGQPTNSPFVNFSQIAKDCGYRWTKQINDSRGLISALKNISKAKGPALLAVKVRKGSRKDLGRPETTPAENKKTFMKKVKL
jgi:phosphonopyruvate decarboxylase